MFLKKDHSIFKTVKTKIALWFATVFALASAITSFGVYCTLHTSMTARDDRLLLTFANALEFHYMRSSSYGTEGDWLSLEKVPAPVIDAARNAKSGIKLFQAQVEKDVSPAIYEITGGLNGLAYVMKIAQTGGVQEIIETSEKDRLDYIENELYSYAYSQGINRMFFLVVSPKGKILARSDLNSWSKPDGEMTFSLQFNNSLFYRTIKFHDHPEGARILNKALFDGNILVIGKSREAQEKILGFYLWLFSGVFISLLIFGSLAGWFIARKAMAGVDRVSKAAISIGQGNFDHRVSEGKEGAEIDNLVSAFNEMIAKIQSLVFELKMVSDNMAHDLCTPLTRIRAMAEVAINGKQDVEIYRDETYGVIEECDQLIRMIRTMIEITRTESGLSMPSKDRVDMKELVSMAYEIFLPLAEDKHIRLNLELLPGTAYTCGERIALQRVVSNLLDNAIKYTQPGGNIQIFTASDENHVQMIVKDNGCGISETDITHIFDRFYRCDSSRSLQGYGLGLCLAHAIVKAHDGSISVESTLGKGSVFIVSLPAFHPVPGYA